MIKNCHEKIINTIESSILDVKYSLPFYGYLNLLINFHESDSIPTCGVNVTTKGMNFYYSPKFLDRLTQKEVNFIVLHEDFHLLFNHPKRTVSGKFNHKMANIVQDMIINHIIVEDISDKFVDIPRDTSGKNMALFVPVEYKGELLFEELYEWFKSKREDWIQNRDKCNSCEKCDGTGKEQVNSNDNSQSDKPGDSESSEKICDSCGGSGTKDGMDSTGKPAYGSYGKNPKGGTLDTWSIEKLFEDLENGNNEDGYLDKHIDDEVTEDYRETVVNDLVNNLKARGLTTSEVEGILNKLVRKKKDYLKYIKRSISSEIFGDTKIKTIKKPSRRGLDGVKGKRKIKNNINVILDTSGSMGGQGTFERVLSFIYRSDISVNLIETDTEIKWVQKFKSGRNLSSLPIKGLGGTAMQPGIDYVVENFNKYNTVLLTDGYTDSLDLRELKGRLLIISVGVEVPINYTNNRVRQITLTNDM